MSERPTLSPASYLVQRAKQIQDELLPKIPELRSALQAEVESKNRQLDELEATLRAEFAVLEAASAVVPPEVLSLDDVEIQEGGTE